MSHVELWAYMYVNQQIWILFKQRNPKNNQVQDVVFNTIKVALNAHMNHLKATTWFLRGIS